MAEIMVHFLEMWVRLFLIGQWHQIQILACIINIKVTKKLPVRKGEIAPWFDEPRGGIQYMLDPDFVKGNKESYEIKKKVLLMH